MQETHSTKPQKNSSKKSGLYYPFGTLVPPTKQQEQQLFSKNTF